MASNTNHFVLLSLVYLLFFFPTNAQLSPTFYATTCPTLQTIVRAAVAQAVATEARMGASLLRLFFHDCFVNGCDGSILLDDTSSFTGEKTALPNVNSVRGYEVIDTIKNLVEIACKATVSCADIVALAARDGTVLLGGPSWTVPLGRRDARTASLSGANNDLPSPFADLSTLISKFTAKKMSASDMTILSGAHAVGFAKCALFRTRIYNETNIDPTFAAAKRANCPSTGGDTNLDSFDDTPNRFDNNYYRDLVVKKGLLHSDQQLFNGGSQDAQVQRYSTNSAAFFTDFAAAMVKMGNISPLTGTAGEIRTNCRVVN